MKTSDKKFNRPTIQQSKLCLLISKYDLNFKPWSKLINSRLCVIRIFRGMYKKDGAILIKRFAGHIMYGRGHALSTRTEFRRVAFPVRAASLRPWFQLNDVTNLTLKFNENT